MHGLFRIIYLVIITNHIIYSRHSIYLTKYNPHFQISIESQTKRLNFEPFGKTKCSKIDKHTAQKNVEKTRFFETVC